MRETAAAPRTLDLFVAFKFFRGEEKKFFDKVRGTTKVKNDGHDSSDTMKTGKVNAQQAKDRLAKSGNPKKRTPSSGGVATPTSSLHPGPQTPTTQNLSGAGGVPGPSGPEDTEIPIVIWPEWSDAEIASEKWATKHAFEDPEGPILLPRSIRGFFEGFKRPVELTVDSTAPIAVQPLPFLDEAFYSQAPTSASSNSGSNNVFVNSPSGMSRNTAGGNGLERLVEDHFSIGNDPSDAVLGAVPIGDGASLAFGAGGDGSSVNPEHAGNENGQNQGGFSVSITSSHHALNSNAEDPNVNGGPAGSGTSSGSPDEAAAGISSAPIGAAAEDDPSSEQESLAGTSKFFQSNRHLLTSDLMRTILAQIHFLFEHSRLVRNAGLPDEFCPWDNLYPKAKDGTPTYNPMGKYAVKLFWLGSWRRITIDDRIPVDDQGRPLVLSSPAPNELWPMLISKALLKLAATSYREADGSIEHGDFDPLYALKGWIPERLQIPASFSIPGPSIISNSAFSRLWTDISSLNVRALQARTGSLAPGFLGASTFGLSSQLNMGPTSSVGPGGRPLGQGAAPDGRQSIYGQNTGPADRSSLHSAGGKNSHQRFAAPIVFAIREGEDVSEKLDLQSIAYPFRISDFRETTAAPQTNGKESDSAHKLIRLKSYFTCGTIRNRRDKSGKPGEDNAIETVPDGTEFWLTFSDFCKSYRAIIIYHSPISFKTVKSTQCVIDPTKPADVIKIPPLLYLPEGGKEATIIISVSTYGRCKAEGLSSTTSVTVEPYEWKYGSTLPGFRKKPLLRINTNGAAGSCLKVNQCKKAYRITIDCPTSYHITFYSREDFFLEDEGKYLSDKLGLFVRDIDETFPTQQAGSWFVLFKNFLRIADPTFVSASLYVPESVQNYTCLRIFDCDSNEEIPQLFYNLKPRLLQPNKNGYMLLADCRSPTARGPGKWKFRLVSQPNPLVSPEKPLDISTKLNTQDLEDMFVPNKHNILFRYVMKVKDGQESHVSAQLSFSLPSIWIKLQVFDNDVEVVSTRGKGTANIHAHLPQSSIEEQTNPPATTGTTAPASNKKEDKAEKKEREEREKAAKEQKEIAALPALPVFKHRYIIQGSIEPSEFIKLLGMNGTIGSGDGVAGGNRPGTSRAGTAAGSSAGQKTTSSAKKKKQSVVPGFAGTNAAIAAASASSPSTGTAGATVGAGAAGAGSTLASSATASSPSGQNLPGGNVAGAGGDVNQSQGNNGGQAVAQADPHTWKLRLISPDSASLLVSRDTEKEDRHKAIKDSWEASHPGRAAKAREAREAYIKQMESGAIKPILFMAAPPSSFGRIAPAALPTIGEVQTITVAAAGVAGATSFIKNTDLVYKAWTIVKEGGVNGRSFNSFRDRGVSVLGVDGQRMIPEPLPATDGAGAPSSAGLRSLSNIRASIVEGRASVSTPPPQQNQANADTQSNSGRTTADVEKSNRPGSGLSVAGEGGFRSNAPPALNVADLSNSRRFSGSMAFSDTGKPIPVAASTLGSEEKLLFEMGMAGSAVTPLPGGDGALASTTKAGFPKDLIPIPTAVPNIHPRVLTPSEKQDREKQREEAWVSFERFFDQAKQQRQSDKEWRQRARVIFAEKLDEMVKEVDKEREEDLGRREQYRQRVIKEIEDAARKALEALRAAEMAALEVSNLEEQAAVAANDKEKKKRAGKR
ncbi:hypothetical protein HDU97_009364 [Phlyctochytrium planicorne]|nr:hypothetical protein HDU97_009364 [Phlyctochytrium planicorne]